jgi:hypothetical protein
MNKTRERKMNVGSHKKVYFLFYFIFVGETEISHAAHIHPTSNEIWQNPSVKL